ncbi:butyrophilin subfamily 3 member A1-like [Trematomus bernacchii]|uniref:butyrophilin subfamily 3 member A1-like n=1 Tax=Trematomus bernacchii TaxID=40690 RepID=UPI00146CB888|nr:butyrophilin subfamily 3 member A1-like [Trematomus bernacchii]
MAGNTADPAETRAEPKLTKKQLKAQETTTGCSSAPWNKPNLSAELQATHFEQSSQSYPRQGNLNKQQTKPDLKSMQSLTECQQLLQKLAEEVNSIAQVERVSERAAPGGGSREPGSLQSSRRLILKWAEELELNMVKKETKPTDENKTRRDDPGEKEKTDLEKDNERLQQWAVELLKIKESNGVSDEELKKLLYPRGRKDSKMAAILPLLEFVAWSLLSEDTEEAVSKLWLPTKQKAWRTGSGSPRYIPNSVWEWIQSAQVSVRLDIRTSHPWLDVSSDRLKVREAAVSSTDVPNYSQQSAQRPCVLGDIVITEGRHYWEVEVSPKGSWRIGVVSKTAPRNLKSTMTPRSGYWTLWRGASLWACTERPTKLRRAAPPRVIGVFVDSEEGQVSFYDAERRVHIYTFSDVFKHSLIPLFSYLDGDTLLKIIPAQISEKM